MSVGMVDNSAHLNTHFFPRFSFGIGVAFNLMLVIFEQELLLKEDELVLKGIALGGNGFMNDIEIFERYLFVYIFLMLRVGNAVLQLVYFN